MVLVEEQDLAGGEAEEVLDVGVVGGSEPGFGAVDGVARRGAGGGEGGGVGAGAWHVCVGLVWLVLREGLWVFLSREQFACLDPRRCCWVERKVVSFDQTGGW